MRHISEILKEMGLTDEGTTERDTPPARLGQPHQVGYLKLVCVDGCNLHQTEIKADRAEALPAPAEGMLKPSQW